ncbi:hypothetical protein CANCADRAFT_142936 [Tortispora caseinolytica NRRL Y-17796]|uniref:Major facilitator superfamily (MFS) profile domain-containing protein n=1 Tax=Tortispora caseinolytica NRRL Y-17796 TaxID=767744 RepID=A0A1E4TD78_9ASCO|nr:hypothetical protein CANCADRAFT_142936 [Tortispora caseinolytica NRRL Y-17796]
MSLQAETEKFEHAEIEDVISDDEKAIVDNPELAAAIKKFENKKAYRRLLLKIDLNIVPACTLLYFLSFLDRGNIGNAKIAGMNQDLGLSDHEYSVALTVFFATYCTFEAPANVVLKILGPKIWLPMIAVCWGAVVLGMGFATNYHQLLALRIMLGFFESATFSGFSYYTSNWYRGHELSSRVAFFFSAATIAGAFSGILAWAIMKLDGTHGIAGWAWIFIIEGALTIGVGLITYFMIHNTPESAGFMKPDEKLFWRHHLQLDHGKGDTEEDNSGFTWPHIKEGALNWRVWAFVLVGWGVTVPLYSFSFFLPTIITHLGWENSTAQLMSAPPYIWACVVTFFNSYLSDKYRKRYEFVVGPLMTFGVIGFVISMATTNLKVMYFGCFLATAGQYSPWPNTVSWNANQYPNAQTRAIAVGIQIGMSSAGGVISSYIFRPQDAPRYLLGKGVCIGAIVLGSLVATFMRFYLKRQNDKKKQYLEEHPEIQDRDPKEFTSLGTKNPFFNYQL